MRTRREFAAGSLAALATLSGCTGFLTGSEALTFEASRATVDQTAVSNAGYQLGAKNSTTIEREFSVAGQTRTVKVTNRVTTYEKSLTIPLVGEAKLGVLAVVSSPAVEIAGQTLNPLNEFDNDKLVELFAGQYQGLQNIEQVSSQQITVLGTDATVTKYAATATFKGGNEVEVYIHVTKVRDGDDFVVPIGVYPRRLEDEQSNILSMMRAIEHSA